MKHLFVKQNVLGSHYFKCNVQRGCYSCSSNTTLDENVYRLDVTLKYLIEIERNATGIKLNYRFQSGKLSLSVAVKRKTFSAKFSPTPCSSRPFALISV